MRLTCVLRRRAAPVSRSSDGFFRMSFFSWRCLTALVAILSWTVQAAWADAGWTATFPSGDGPEDSVAFAVGDGRHLVAVAVSGMDAGKGRLKLEGRELPAEVFVDPVSRLVVFRMAGPPGKAMPLMASSATGESVRFGGGTGRVTGMVKQIDGKILPLCLLKVGYDGEAPSPGTPLTNSVGAVIGVAHQTIGPKEGYALPVEVVRRVLDDVQAGGRVQRGWIGLKLQPAAAMAQVTGIQAGSPSEKSGVKSGDILVQVGHRRVGDYADAVNAFYFLRPGTVTPLRVRRGNQEIVLSVTPVEKAGE